ncbi:Gmad2 immunoglobulin-like domain-containing protein [Oceanobacillus alkalisoli]|uniref:Gmad2 immunoglobulin-like domain-containing protein n=1 Tax=Oceanobacillus alkalisoli TaxID=2925113 RepID=UPI001EE4706D|nr:Gmad2 immunoglobulin-like domain-containing protein [Oceanobacillus alkalisoli]MCG5102146.1 Gmad2 immunoglobulin-like domain-containing protein [Oceanobacillus alkalisoli]
MKKVRLTFFTITLFGVLFLSACGGNEVGSDTEQQDEPEQEDVAEDEGTEEDTTENREAAEEDTEEEANSGNASDGMDIVAENDAFKVFEPAPDSVVANEFIVRGEARVFEANVSYEFEDGHNILAKGFVTASQGAPEWGEFEITISFDEVANDTGLIVLYEESAKDGSRQNELIIPVKVKD